jgi:hypothetical protein
VAGDPAKASAEPARQISGFFLQEPFPANNFEIPESFSNDLFPASYIEQ